MGKRWAVAAAVTVAGVLVSPPASGQENPSPRTVTLTVDRTDILYGQRVRLSGRIDPPPDPSKTDVSFSTLIPGQRYSDSTTGPAKLAADGTFTYVDRPRTNLRYAVYVNEEDEDIYYSPPVRVYVESTPRVFWRRRPGGVIEAVMRMRPMAGDGLDYLDRRTAHFYGLRRPTSRVARHVLKGRVFYPRDDSTARPHAYAKRKVRHARRIRLMLACVPEPHADSWGRADSPFRLQCGRRLMRLPRVSSRRSSGAAAAAPGAARSAPPLR
jgi:hypothetical protein